MKNLRYLTLLGGLIVLVFALGFVFRVPAAIGLWPWSDGPLSYLFIGSILAAISVAMFWIGWTGEFAALGAGTLNLLVIAVGTSIYFFQLAMQPNRAPLIVYAILGVFIAIASGVAFLWSRRFVFSDSRPTPTLVRVSFGIFIASLIMAGVALVLRMPIFPWALNPDSSVIFGCIFIGDAFYFLYGVMYPRWHNALGQLLSFLAYDLVLIVPFLLLFQTVKTEYLVSLIVYVLVLIYSGALAVYFLFIHPPTRLGSRTSKSAKE